MEKGKIKKEAGKSWVLFGEEIYIYQKFGLQDNQKSTFFIGYTWTKEKTGLQGIGFHPKSRAVTLLTRSNTNIVCIFQQSSCSYFTHFSSKHWQLKNCEILVDHSTMHLLQL